MTVIQIETTSTATVVQAAFHARLRSLTPLLQHAPTAMKPQSNEIGRAGKKNIPTPEDEAEMGAYRLKNGVLYLPAVALQRTMIEAGKSFQNPTNKRATMMKVIAATLVPPPVEGFPLMTPDGEPISEYEIDVRRAVVQRAAIMRARPRIDEWEADVSMEFDIEALGSGGNGTEDALRAAGEILLMILAHAGKRVGIGDYRPERSGPFGRFEVVAFQVDDESR